MEGLTGFLITSGVGLIAGFAGAFLKHLLDTRMKVDENLRTTREPRYRQLWKITKLLPEWPRAEVTYEQLRDMSTKCRSWYFEVGGMYLSARSRELYSGVQDRLAAFFSDELVARNEVISDDTYDEIRSSCSALRTSMTDDLLSRRGRWDLGQWLRHRLSAGSPAERRRSQKDAIQQKILDFESQSKGATG